jgi:lipopolysaccharide export system protein LptA
LEWDQNKGVYIAEGDATAVQLDTRISADRLEASYDPETDGREINLMTAIGNVSFVDGENTASGARLVYDLTSSIYSVFGKNAKVTSPRGVMTATNRIIYDESNPAKAKINGVGKANYTADDGRIVAGDEIIAYTNEAGDLQTLDAIGNAYVRTVDNQTATGDKVNYDFNTSIAILTGNVELIEGQNVMRGSRAEVDFNSGVSRLLSDGQGGRVTGIMVQ